MYVCEISFSPADLFLYELLLSAEHATATTQTAPTCHSWNGNTKFQTAQFQFFVLDLPQVHYLIIKFCTCTAVPILFHCPSPLALILKTELATYTTKNVRKFEGQCMYWGSFSGRACAHQQLAECPQRVVACAGRCNCSVNQLSPRHLATPLLDGVMTLVHKTNGGR